MFYNHITSHAMLIKLILSNTNGSRSIYQIGITCVKTNYFRKKKKKHNLLDGY